MKLMPELVPLIEPILAAGINVFALPEGKRAVNWVVIERDGNVGVVGYRDYGLEGPYVDFAIKPSQATGSSLLVMTPSGREPRGIEEILAAAKLAVGSRYANFATSLSGLPNHGWTHFDWCRDRLVPVTGADLQSEPAQ